MYKYLIIAILTISCFVSSYAQNNKEKLLSSKQKNKRVFKPSVSDLLAEADNIRFKNPEEALDKVKDALILSLSNKEQVNEAQCYILLGKINQQIEEWDLAIESFNYAKKALESSEDTSNLDNHKAIFRGLARSNIELGKYQQGLSYLSAEKKLLNGTALAESYLQSAEVHYLTQQDEMALTAVDMADSLLKQNPNQLLQGQTQAMRAKVLARGGKLKQAEEFYRIGLANSLQVMDTIYESYLDVNSTLLSTTSSNNYLQSSKEELIKGYYQFNQTSQALNLRNNSISYNEKMNNPLEVVREKQALSNELILQGKANQAIKQLNDALRIADSLNNYKELAATNKALAKLWDKRRNNTKALTYFREYSRAMDVVLHTEQKKQTQKEKLLTKQNSIISFSRDVLADNNKEELALVNNRLSENQIRLQQLYINGLLLLLLISIIAVFLIFRKSNKNKTISQLLHLKSLRSQMNPHFIFNSLNSVNQFIAKNDERAANSYLSGFSKLMRLVLDNSHKDFITLAEEKEILGLYLKLEHHRFRDKFNYEFTIDEAIALDQVELPPMLIQPYIENAVWHGLRYMDGMGFLEVNITQNSTGLIVTISDDGIGRQKSQELKTKNQKSHQSSGLKNTKERMKVINKVYKKSYTVAIDNLNDDQTGTVVTLNLPF